MVKWDNLPEKMKNSKVRQYYELLSQRQNSLACKRALDIFLSVALITVLSPLMLLVGLIVKLSSPGPVFFLQQRVTKGLKLFYIIKFRSMKTGETGASITVVNDTRVTSAGRVLRKYRLDELPQLFNILMGDMSFVGARPEIPKYVEAYTEEMLATLLLPAGLTSEASISFANEEEQLKDAQDVDKYYIEIILPQKMNANLEYIQNYRFIDDFAIIVKTVIAMIR